MRNKMRWTAKAMAFLMAGCVALSSAAMAKPLTAEAAAVGSPTMGEDTRTTGTLTIQKQKAGTDNPALSGAEFSLYKVMGVDINDEYASYTVEGNFEDVLTDIEADALGSYSAAELEDLIAKLAVKAQSLTATATETSDATGKAEFTNLALGYYLVMETTAPEGYVAGDPFLVSIPSTDNYTDTSKAGTEWVYDVTANPKNAEIELEKKLPNDNAPAIQDGTVGLGDYIKYEVQTTIPNYGDEYFEGENVVTFILTDVMCDGLAIQNKAEHPVEVKVDGIAVTAGADTYTLTAENKIGEVNKDAADLTVAFASSYIQKNCGKKVVLTYWAQVTKDAVTGTAGDNNTATLTYSNKPGTITDGHTDTKDDDVDVYSFKIQVEKFTNDDTTTAKPLPGAEFELYKGTIAENTKVKGADGKDTYTTDDKGILKSPQLDAGTYWLKETKSPAGYTLLANPIKVEITAVTNTTTGKLDGTFTLKVNGEEVTVTTGTYVARLDQATGTAIIAVENHPGFNLPATGGMGITLFLMIGAAGIIVLSVAMTKKTKKSE